MTDETSIMKLCAIIASVVLQKNGYSIQYHEKREVGSDHNKDDDINTVRVDEIVIEPNVDGMKPDNEAVAKFANDLSIAASIMPDMPEIQISVISDNMPITEVNSESKILYNMEHKIRISFK